MTFRFAMLTTVSLALYLSLAIFGVREDRSNRWVIGALGVLGFADAYLPAYSDRHDILTFGGEAALV